LESKEEILMSRLPIVILPALSVVLWLPAAAEAG